jgi:branched-chain amino acid transport system substrate-binding protein
MINNCQLLKAKSLIRYIFPLIGLLFPATIILAQGDDNILYERAHRLMDQKQYSEAHQIFAQLADYGSDIQMDAAYQFYAAKAGYYSGYLDESLEAFGRVINGFPQSNYVPYSYFFSGNIYCFLGRPDQAVLAYTDAFKTSEDGKLDRLAIESLGAIASAAPSVVVENLPVNSISDKKRCSLLIPLAQKLIENNNFQSIRLLLSSCNSVDAARLVEQADQFSKQQVTIGILAPLSGELQRFGEALIDGINFMIDRYQSRTGLRLTPIIYDTRGDQLEAARIIRRLSASEAAAAIGPLTSEEASVSSAVLACGDLPLIIPAASQSGLTELSSSSFQLLPNLAWQGRKMADFAVGQLGADTAAIITPTTPENLRMAKAFASRFEELGGTILCIEYFRAKETDFGSYVKDIKSLINGQLLDSIVFINDDGDSIEAEEVSVRLDCLYIPADADQLRMILPQIDFYNLHTTYLGGDGWGSDLVYNLGDNVTKGSYFSSGRLESSKSEIGQQFMANFDAKYGHPPGHLETVGYDAMGLICRALSSGLHSRVDISHFLSTVKGFNGASGTVSFGENRENTELPIYKIEGGLPIRMNF